MLKVVICDDDADYMQILAEKVNQYLHNKDLDFSVKCYHSLSCLEESLRSEKIDILFLDIMFGEQSSVDWAKSNLTASKINLIFMTGFAQEAYNISEVPHSYYIIKSKCTQAILDSALSKAISAATKKDPNLTVIKIGDEKRVISYQNIMYIESMNNHILLHMNDDEVFPLYSTLSKYAEQLPVNFLQCHKSFIINMNFITAFKPCCFTLGNSASIVIPAKKYKAATKKYEIYLKNFGK